MELMSIPWKNYIVRDVKFLIHHHRNLRLSAMPPKTTNPKYLFFSFILHCFQDYLDGACKNISTWNNYFSLPFSELRWSLQGSFHNEYTFWQMAFLSVFDFLHSNVQIKYIEKKTYFALFNENFWILKKYSNWIAFNILFLCLESRFCIFSEYAGKPWYNLVTCLRGPDCICEKHSPVSLLNQKISCN